MPDFQPPQWSEFKVPGGGADLSYVGPVANAYSEAARMAVNPLQRAFEQALAQKMQERMATREMQFREQQANRQYEEQTMLQKMQDAAALKRIEAEIEGRKQIEQLGIERKGAAALALRDLMDPMLMQGQQGGAPQGAQGVQPGTGPLSLESMAQLPPQAGGGSFPPLSIDDATAKALGPEGVEGAVRTWASERERKTNNAEQAATAEAKRAAAEAARASMDTAQRTILGDKALDDASKVRLLARLPGDQAGAWDEYQQIIKEQRDAEADKVKAKLAKSAEEETGFFRHEVPGVGPVRLPLSVRLPMDEKRPMPWTSAPVDAKDALWQVARNQVSRDLVGRGEITALDAQRLFEPGNPMAGRFSDEVRLRVNEIASQFGWEREPGFESGGAGQSQPKPQGQPGQADGQAGKPAPLDHKGVYGELIKQYGREPTREEFRDAMLRNQQGLPLSAQQSGSAAASPASTTQAPKKSADELRKAAGSYVSRAEQREIDAAAKEEAKSAGDRAAEAAMVVSDRAFLESAIGSVPKTPEERKDALDRLDDLIDDASGGYKDKLKRARSMLYDMTASGGK